MRGPTCIFWSNLTPFLLQPLAGRGGGRPERGTAPADPDVPCAGVEARFDGPQGLVLLPGGGRLLVCDARNGRLVQLALRSHALPLGSAALTEARPGLGRIVALPPRIRFIPDS